MAADGGVESARAKHAITNIYFCMILPASLIGLRNSGIVKEFTQETEPGFGKVFY
jgi:hypothetical protein